MIPRRIKTLEETMKTVILTPISSVKSTTTVDASENRDSFYFPGCRKDANCSCEICIASMNATLDLMPQSIHRSSLTKFSSSRRMIARSPVSFTASSADISTPETRVKISRVDVSPPGIESTERMSVGEKGASEKRDLGYGVCGVRFVLGLVLVLGLEFGVSWMVLGVMKPSLSSDVVMSLGKKSQEFEALNSRFVFLRNELEGLVGKKVSRCSSVDSVWKVTQDGLLLNSRCVLYRSMTEEVSIWGWPLQSSGLLIREYSSRSFSIINGRLTEWSSEEAKFVVREANSSWTQGKWSSSVVQLDPNTWIFEYKRSSLVENARLVSAAAEFLKFRLAREFEKMKQEIWLLHSFGSQYLDFTRGSVPIPT